MLDLQKDKNEPLFNLKRKKNNNTEPLFNTILDRYCHNLLKKGTLSLQLIMQTTILVTTTATVLISVDYD